jgi:hypothetical protein
MLCQYNIFLVDGLFCFAFASHCFASVLVHDNRMSDNDWCSFMFVFQLLLLLLMMMYGIVVSMDRNVPRILVRTWVALLRHAWIPIRVSIPVSHHYCCYVVVVVVSIVGPYLPRHIELVYSNVVVVVVVVMMMVDSNGWVVFRIENTIRDIM